MRRVGERIMSPHRVLLTPASFLRKRFASCSYGTGNSARKASEPLRILFCGSDDFSCASLKALCDEQARNAALIRSIDIVVRPPKPTGRGGKVLRKGMHISMEFDDKLYAYNVFPVPLQILADELQLPVYERDTFTGWKVSNVRYGDGLQT
jgi:hypothetical protein